MTSAARFAARLLVQPTQTATTVRLVKMALVSQAVRVKAPPPTTKATPTTTTTAEPPTHPKAAPTTTPLAEAAPATKTVEAKFVRPTAPLKPYPSAKTVSVYPAPSPASVPQASNAARARASANQTYAPETFPATRTEAALKRSARTPTVPQVKLQTLTTTVPASLKRTGVKCAPKMQSVDSTANV